MERSKTLGSVPVEGDAPAADGAQGDDARASMAGDAAQERGAGSAEAVGAGGERAEGKDAADAGASEGRRRVKLYVLNDSEWTDFGTGTVAIERRTDGAPPAAAADAAAAFPGISPAHMPPEHHPDAHEAAGGGAGSPPPPADSPPPAEVTSAMSSVLASSAAGPMSVAAGTPIDYIVCRSEDEPEKVLLEHRIVEQFIYSRTDHTLILWMDPETKRELALSFQDSRGCMDLWNELCAIQGRPAASAATDEAGGDAPVQLPPAELGKLAALSKYLTGLHMTQRASAARTLWTEGYLPKLFELFRQCEDIGDEQALGQLFAIFREIVLLNDNVILEHLTSAEQVMDFVGIFEYDPIAPAKHREALRERAVLRQVVPLPSEVERSIRAAYHLSYVRDVVLARILDEPTIGTLMNLVYRTNVSVALTLRDESTFWMRLLRASGVDGSAKGTEHDPIDLRGVMLFLQEFFTMLRSIQSVSRTLVITTLYEAGVMHLFSHALASSDVAVRLAATSILQSWIFHDVSAVREFIVREGASGKLFPALLDRLTRDGSPGVREQCTSILYSVLGANASAQQLADAHQAGVLGLFYDHFVQAILEPFDGFEGDEEAEEMAAAGGGGNASSSSEAPPASTSAPSTPTARAMRPPAIGDTAASAAVAATAAEPSSSTAASSSAAAIVRSSRWPDEVKNTLCNVLAFCVMNHAYRIKVFLVRKRRFHAILALLHSREAYVRLSALRFFRTCLELSDDFYTDYIIKGHMFDAVMDAFEANRRRNNLFQSAVLELFHFLGNVKPPNTRLLDYLVLRFGDRFRKISFTTVFKDLIEVQQNSPRADDENTIAAAPEQPNTDFARRERAARDEEAYWDADDDEAAKAPKYDEGPLVDAEDDFRRAFDSNEGVLVSTLYSSADDENEDAEDGKGTKRKAEGDEQSAKRSRTA